MSSYKDELLPSNFFKLWRSHYQMALGLGIMKAASQQSGRVCSLRSDKSNVSSLPPSRSTFQARPRAQDMVAQEEAGTR